MTRSTKRRVVVEWEGSKRAQFKEAHGFEPASIPVCLDVFAVIVNRRNPLESVSIAQLRNIFSGSSEIATWGEVGLPSEWSARRIRPHFLLTTSLQAPVKFWRAICGEATYSDKVVMQPGLSSIERAVEEDEAAIGCVRTGFITDDVRVVGLKPTRDADAVLPRREAAQSAAYPLSVVVYATPRADADGRIESTAREFIRYLVSRQAQETVQKVGFTSVEADFIRTSTHYKTFVEP